MKQLKLVKPTSVPSPHIMRRRVKEEIKTAQRSVLVLHRLVLALVKYQSQLRNKRYAEAS